MDYILKNMKYFQALFGTSDCHKQGTRVSIWKDQSVSARTMTGVSFVHLDHNIPVTVLQVIWSFKALIRVPYLR